MKNRLILLALFILMGCTTNPEKTPSTSSAEPQAEAAKGGAGAMTQSAALALVNNQMSRSELWVARCKRDMSGENLNKCRTAYDNVYVTGTTMTKTGGELLVANAWDGTKMNDLGTELDKSMNVFRKAAGDSTSASSYLEIGTVLVSIFFQLYDGFRTRSVAERNALGATLRDKKWPAWDSIKAAEK